MFITLQCHYPLFVRGCVKHDCPQDLGHGISKLYVFVHWITSEEIHVARIPWWRQEIVEIFCMFEKELPTSFMDLKVQLLIHLVDEAELIGVVSYHWILFLERYMKKLIQVDIGGHPPIPLWAPPLSLSVFFTTYYF